MRNWSRPGGGACAGGIVRAMRCLVLPELWVVSSTPTEPVKGSIQVRTPSGETGERRSRGGQKGVVSF